MRGGGTMPCAQKGYRYVCWRDNYVCRMDNATCAVGIMLCVPEV